MEFKRAVILFVFLFVTNGLASFIAPFPDLPIDIISGVNQNCNSDSELFRSSLDNNTLWAFQMWDSSHKGSAGILDGRSFRLGQYDECLSVKGPFETKYCLVDIKIAENVTFSPTNDEYINFYEKFSEKTDFVRNYIKTNSARVGICIPKSCTSEDVQGYMVDYYDKNFKEVTYEINVNKEDCSSEDLRRNFSPGDIIFCIVISLIIILTLTGTVYELLYGKNEDKNQALSKFLFCFSARKNLEELPRKDKNIALHPIYGLRSIIMILVVSVHSRLVTLSGPVNNYGNAVTIRHTVLGALLRRGDVTVDIFFLFGGLLTTYNFLKQSETVRVNPLRYLMHRYIRVMSVFAFMTFFYSTIFYKLGSGPLWNTVIGNESKCCQKNWWVNLLLVNNYVNLDYNCIIQAWYLAIDWHMFVLSYPLNIILHKREKTGLILLGIIFTILAVTPVIPFFHLGLNVFKYTVVVTEWRYFSIFRELYIPTHMRGSHYLIGMLFGYIYFKLRTTKFEISKVNSYTVCLGEMGPFKLTLQSVRRNKWVNLLFFYRTSHRKIATCYCTNMPYSLSAGWRTISGSHFRQLRSLLIALSCLAAMVGSLLITIKYYRPYDDSSLVEIAIYGCLHRSLYIICFGIGMIVLTHAKGQPFLVVRFLSASFWVSFSKLTFGIYMTHMVFLFYKISTFRTSFSYSNYTTICSFIAELLFSTIFSLILYLTVEMPAGNLSKILLPKDKKNESTEPACK